LRLGGLPATNQYILASKILTLYYFFYFIVLIPNLYVLEGPMYFSQKRNLVVNKYTNETYTLDEYNKIKDTTEKEMFRKEI
jgi:hypothetical protein